LEDVFEGGGLGGIMMGSYAGGLAGWVVVGGCGGSGGYIEEMNTVALGAVHPDR
jgi:hypothetical protein